MPELAPENPHALALSCSIEVIRGMLGEAIDYLDHDRHGNHFHAFTPVGISKATARKSSVASFKYTNVEFAAR